MFEKFSLHLRHCYAKKSKSVVSKSIANDIFIVNTLNLSKQSTSVGMLRQDRTVFLSNNWKAEILDEEQKEIIAEFLMMNHCQNPRPRR